MAYQVRRTAELFVEGKPLLTMVGKDLSIGIETYMEWRHKNITKDS